jgi:hypothetical protein
METLYYDGQKRNIYLCNARGDVLAFHYPIYPKSPIAVAQIVGIVRSDWLNLSSLDEFLQFWGKECIYITFYVDNDIEMRLGRVDDFDFVEMKFFEVKQGSSYDFRLVNSGGGGGGGEIPIFRDITEISDECFLLHYEYACYYNSGQFGKYYRSGGNSDIYLRQMIMYASFSEMPEREIEVYDLLAIERLRRLGKID